jgi:hypothetical protein
LTVTPVWLGAIPETVSVAVQVNETVPVCQLASAAGQLIAGAVLSILTPVIGPAVAQLPALSHTETEFVEALWLLVPGGMDAVRETLDWLGVASPDPTSVAVHAKETVPACQFASAVGQLTTGAALSIMNPVTAGMGVQLLTLSQICPLAVDAFAFDVPAGTEVLSCTVPPATPDCVSVPLHVTV